MGVGDVEKKERDMENNYEGEERLVLLHLLFLG